MDFTATGSLSISLASVAYCIARGPTWHAWTRADQFPEGERFAKALAKVHITSPSGPAQGGAGYDRAELEALRPYAVVTQLPPAMMPPAREIYVRTRCATEQFLEWHTNWIQVVSDVPLELQNLTPRNYHYVLNRISLLIDEILVWSGTESEEGFPMPIVQRLALMDGPAFPDAELVNTQGYFSTCILRIESGLRR